MGADVAASPHCPVAAGYQAWEARQSAGRFRGGGRAGGSDHFLRGPSGARAPFGFPAGSPSGPKPWRFAARQIRRTGVPGPAVSGSAAEARCRLRQESLGRSLSPAWQSRGLASAAAASQLPGLGPVLPDGARAETLLPPVAARRLASRFCRTGGGPKPVPAFSVADPKVRKPGRFTKPATLASAKGKPAASAWRRLRQPPGPPLGCLMPGGTQGRFARAVAGKASDRCRSIVSATGRKLSWIPIRTKAIPAVDNEDSGHK